MSNQNRIVRVFNDKTHKMISYVSKLTKTSYQHVFNEYMAYIEEGHIFGEFTHHILIERILKNNS